MLSSMLDSNRTTSILDHNHYIVWAINLIELEKHLISTLLTMKIIHILSILSLASPSTFAAATDTESGVPSKEDGSIKLKRKRLSDTTTDRQRMSTTLNGGENVVTTFSLISDYTFSKLIWLRLHVSRFQVYTRYNVWITSIRIQVTVLNFVIKAFEPVYVPYTGYIIENVVTTFTLI